MKIYRILHKPTGLYFQNYRQYVKSGLGPKGNIYKRKIDVDRIFQSWNTTGHARIKLTTGLYKKIKDKLTYDIMRTSIYSWREDLEEDDRYVSWDFYAPVDDFEIIEGEI